MSKVITFSRQFPSYHPKVGQPTGFVEKIWQSLFNVDERMPPHTFLDQPGLEDAAERFRGPYDFDPKHHTIRAGHRFKAGDWFSPRVWSGKPYNSKQIQFAPDIQVKKVWDFEMRPAAWWDECEFYVDGVWITASVVDVAKNDGLEFKDFIAWFAGPDMMSSKRKPFHGQIICWGDVEY